MSAAAAVETAVPVRSGKNKLVQINVVALVPLLAAAGGVALFAMKRQARAQHEADAEGTAQTPPPARTKRDPSVVPAFMPSIRNNILTALSHKRSSGLPQRSVKARLAHEVQRKAGRALGLEPAAPGAVQGDAAPPRPVRAVPFSNFIIQ